MIYRIIETTDSQHRGAIISIESNQKTITMPDGDIIKINRIKKISEIYYKLISFNYLAIMELVGE